MPSEKEIKNRTMCVFSLSLEFVVKVSENGGGEQGENEGGVWGKEGC